MVIGGVWTAIGIVEKNLASVVSFKALPRARHFPNILSIDSLQDTLRHVF